MPKTRKIFFVVASGGHDTAKHYQDTIERKHNISEIGQFLSEDEKTVLTKEYHNGPFALWGATPGPGNARCWDKMEPGDYVLIYRGGRIIFAAEIALKVHNKELAKFFWSVDENGQTWEYMYFMVNTEAVNVPLTKLNPLLGYKENYSPRGFMAIEQDKADLLLGSYGDVLSVLRQLEAGKDLEKVDRVKKEQELEQISEKVERATTEHDEMQWRLIRLGISARVDVWVPRSDQGKSYQGNAFRPHVQKEFQASIDVPKYVENIDVVWKYGHSIKAAFEVEHSTSIYSGILRLSDLRALTPNSVYPLFIVADRERRNKVFSELRRPTFDNPYLRLREVISFLSYDKIRELDNDAKASDANVTTDFLKIHSEKI